MAKIQIKHTEYDSGFLPKQHKDINFTGTVKEKVEDTIKNKAIYNLLKLGQYKKYWLPDNKKISYPAKDSPELQDFITAARTELKSSITFNQTSLIEKNDGEVRLGGVCIFGSSDQIFNFIDSSYSVFLSDKEEQIEDQGTDTPPVPIHWNAETGVINKIYKVDLFDVDTLLALRSAPGAKEILGDDIYLPGPPPISSLTKKHGTQTNDLGGLVGLLPHGTGIFLLSSGHGAKGQWDQIKVASIPSISGQVLVDKVGYVDAGALFKSGQEPPTPEGQKAADEIIAKVTPAGLSKEDEDFIRAQLYPPVIETVTPEATKANPGVKNTSITPDWTRRTPLSIFKNAEDQRYEITVRIPVDLEGDRKEEARRIGLRTLLRYFNVRSDEAYVIKLLYSGAGEISQVKNYWADDNVNNRTVYYLVITPYLGPGGFNYKKYEQAEVLTIEEMVVERIIDFQIVLSTNQAEKKIESLIDVLKNKIKRGLDNYNGVVDGAPDIDYEIKKLELFIPKLKETLAENNIKWRSSKEDQIELGLDADLKILYVRFGPEDGKDGDWKLK